MTKITVCSRFDKVQEYIDFLQEKIASDFEEVNEEKNQERELLIGALNELIDFARGIGWYVEKRENHKGGNH